MTLEAGMTITPGKRMKAKKQTPMNKNVSSPFNKIRDEKKPSAVKTNKSPF